ncbi:hypothetical protein [uncultured Alistipes sp.]|nr:hypothetical protein [uncultured Alistipes sp.]
MERGFWFNKDKYFAQTRKNIPRNLGAGRVRLFSVVGFPLPAFRCRPMRGMLRGRQLFRRKSEAAVLGSQSRQPVAAPGEGLPQQRRSLLIFNFPLSIFNSRPSLIRIFGFAEDTRSRQKQTLRALDFPYLWLRRRYSVSAETNLAVCFCA